MKPVVCIGDVHGCYSEFVGLTNKLRTMGLTGEQIVCLGDFMDKGPEPIGCLRHARREGYRVVKSNHEERHARWWRRERRREQDGTPNMMRPWHEEAEAKANAELTEEEVAWIEGLPPWIELIPGWIAVHGGFRPGVPLKDQDPEKVIRLRSIRPEDGKPVNTNYDDQALPIGSPPGSVHWTDLWTGPESVVYGHEAFSLHQPKRTYRATRQLDKTYWLNGDIDVRPMPGPTQVTETWGIDTGVVHGGHLTALVLPEKDLVQVKAKKCYMNPPLPIPA